MTPEAVEACLYYASEVQRLLQRPNAKDLAAARENIALVISGLRRGKKDAAEAARKPALAPRKAARPSPPASDPPPAPRKPRAVAPSTEVGEDGERINAVPIRSEWIHEIFAGRKTWEIRSRPTKIRGTIGLIESGTLTVVGKCEIVDVIGPLTDADISKKARESSEDYGGCEDDYAWVLSNIQRFKKPVPYKHPSGAVTWVKLDEATTAAVLRAAGTVVTTPSVSIRG